MGNERTILLQIEKGEHKEAKPELRVVFTPSATVTEGVKTTRSINRLKFRLDETMI